MGDVMLRCGAGAPQVEAALLAVGLATGLASLDVDITVQSLLMQARTASGQVITRLRVVRSTQRDYGRLGDVHQLVDDIVSGDVSVDEATTRLRAIRRAPRTWSRWVIAFATGLIAAGVALSLGAGLVASLFSMLTGVVVDRLTRWLDRYGIPDFYLGALGGFVATLLAWAAYAMGRYDWVPITPSDFAFLVAGGIVALLPSRTIASAMEDVISGYPVTGTARMFAVLFHTFGLAIGVAAALAVTLRGADVMGLELTAPPIEKLAWASGSLTVLFIGSGIVAIAGAVTMQARRRMLLPSALVGLVGVGIAAGLGQLDVGRVTATGIASIVMAFIARVVALRLGAPGMVLAVPASFALLPGLSIFVGLHRLVGGGSDVQSAGWTTLLSALGIIMAIATGSTLGELLASPLDRGVGRRRRRHSRTG
ncbi:threonine/serine ThrE exporter family protein [Janibacter sp. G1551]|uniref:threonine/serine ThrE exporter family protein n=1 Tax=Janibacter sp. G1551 TaxID=3420440 RepID=UPI003D08FCC0